ncbi:MAG TPA: DUF3795 domain-containing protein [Williamwhitmania sp.]|nr:DUF3795 domain-containing protein [Williamwhitmania sp.]
MKEIVSDVSLVAKCGLYCGACRSYLKGKCPGCKENVKATWCKVRTCCLENSYASCADCKSFANPMECKLYNNFIARIFGYLFNSDRNACITMIKQTGYYGFASYMAENWRQSIKRK